MLRGIQLRGLELFSDGAVVKFALNALRLLRSAALRRLYVDLEGPSGLRVRTGSDRRRAANAIGRLHPERAPAELWMVVAVPFHG